MIMKILLVFLLVNLSNGYPSQDRGSQNNAQMTMNQGLDYLMKYGYVEDEDTDMVNMKKMNSQQLRDSSSMKGAIRDFQCTWGLSQTGEMDSDTMELMRSKRCGMTDSKTRCRKGVQHHSRSKRFTATNSYIWPNKKVSYKINTYTRDLSSKDVDVDMDTAMNLWSDASQLKVTRLSGGVPDINVDFYRGNHGDGDTFDGPGGVLAHAFFPGRNSLDGDIHFDDDETFTKNTRSGINFLWVAAHEAGHALGLGHSNVREALMAPYYTGYEEDFKLNSDDEAGIRFLYGNPEEIVTEAITTTTPPTTTTTKTTTTTTTTTTTKASTDEVTSTNEYATTTESYEEENESCFSPPVDVVTRTLDGSVYIFKDSFYYKLHGGTHTKRRIADDWPRLPNNVEAALYMDNFGYTVFIKSGWAYAYQNKNLILKLPVSSWLKGIPSKIDSIFYYYYNGYNYLYVTVGNQYYRINRYTNTAERNYPKPLSVWWKNSYGINDLPKKLHAGFQSRSKRLFFFSEDKYYYFSSYKNRIVSVNDISALFKCPKKTNSWALKIEIDDNSSKGIDMIGTISEMPTENSIDKDKMAMDPDGLDPLENEAFPVDTDEMMDSEDTQDEGHAVPVMNSEPFDADNDSNASVSTNIGFPFSLVFMSICALFLKF